MPPLTTDPHRREQARRCFDRAGDLDTLLTIGDKSIVIYYVYGTAAISIQNSATKKMIDEVFLKQWK